ncbi:Fe-S cluster assembly scaffold SufA [Chthonobacter albigriseus]|jgi:iron-sulfur cluster assembly protein|uniref:Fe-S cluster assembly scaffold SufA n=1 Tax=Chthonobacter albigriseus TaxID=1683161 RepID=UPI0015EF1DF9|nr:Fe-S cluster assembly scaffold SufA [Chthonobacter albigriseus]
MAMARRKLEVMSVTTAAAERVQEILESADGEAVGVRVGVKNGGCAGMSYTMELARETRPSDERVEAHGVTVFIDPKAVLFLLGTEMDFERTTLKTGFVFKNPNQVGACGCGESVNLVPAQATA